MFVSPVQQALGACTGRAEILQGCAGLGGIAGKAEMCRAGGHNTVKQSSCRAVQALGGGGWPGGDVNVRGSLALRAHPVEILQFWGVGVWGSTALAGQRIRTRGSEIPCCMEQRLLGPMGRGWVCGTCYSFSIWWCGEASHKLKVQSADVSALPGVLPQSSKSQASYQSPQITEVRRSVAVFWLPSSLSISWKSLRGVATSSSLMAW
jgi:hypothetical protein